jgi:hypothetical protein
MVRQTRLEIHVKCLLFSPNFTKNRNVSILSFRKNIKIHQKIRPVEVPLFHADRGTENFNSILLQLIYEIA